MCGIAGIFHYGDPATEQDAQAIKQMTGALAHRGPDGEGIFAEGAVALGHRRLAIIDLSPAGAQPMESVSGSTLITFNGEIYNYRELRADLEKMGRAFKSRSDTEVILNSYEQWGPSCVERFNGIFAFAIWDRANRKLFLARDRMGVKPLFYFDDGHRLLFASEIKAILSAPAVRRTVCAEGLSSFLTFGYVAAPLTGFEGIRQLAPASTLTCGGNGIAISRYWEPKRPPDAARFKSLDEAAEEFGTVLRRCVKRQMVSDAPLGAFLSGGLDSAAIVSAMAGQSDAPVKTFCASFEQGQFDESAQAARTAATLGVDHHTTMVPEDLAGTLLKAVRHIEDPFADSSLLNFFSICGCAAGNVKVALSGDGGDELLAGYFTYDAGYAAGPLKFLPAFFIELLKPVARALPLSDYPYGLRNLAVRFLDGMGEPAGRDHASWRIHCGSALKNSLFNEDLAARTASFDPLKEYAARYNEGEPGLSRLGRMLRADMLFHLPNDMLVKVDRMSMAHGLEVRVPFLDNELVDFCLGLPDEYLFSPFRGRKIILRRHLDTVLGCAWSRGPKRGFNAPISQALRGSLFDLFMDAIHTEPFCGHGPLRIDRLEKIANDHKDRREDYAYPLFTALVLALWWNTFELTAG